MRRCLLCLSCFFVLSCGGFKEIILEPKGTTGWVQLEGKRLHPVEFVALENDTLYCIGSGLEAIPISSVQRIHLDIDRSLGWIPAVILTQVLPVGLILGVESDETVIVAGVAITGVTILSMALTTPQNEYSQPWMEGKKDQLRTYMRLPFGLSEEQIGVLSDRYGRADSWKE